MYIKLILASALALLLILFIIFFLFINASVKTVNDTFFNILFYLNFYVLLILYT